MNFRIDLSAGQDAVSRGTTYVDLALDLQRDDSGKEFAVLTDVDSIKNGIRNIFAWYPGQRILKPDFGNLLPRLVYENMNSMLIKKAQDLVRSMLRWETRINIDKVDVSWEDDSNTLYIAINYTIPSLGVSKTYKTTLSPTYMTTGNYQSQITE